MATMESEGSSRGTYPILLVPKGLDYHNFYSSAQQRPIEPTKPTKHSYSASFRFDSEDWLRTVLCVAGMVAAPYVIRFFDEKLYPIWTVGVWLVLHYVIYHPFDRHAEAKSRVAQHDKDYEDQMKAYATALSRYNAEVEHYDSFIGSRSREQQIETEKRAMVRNSLAKTSYYPKSTSLTGQLVGASEGILYTALRDRFPDRMRRDISIDIPAHRGYTPKFAFRPDMVYHDKASRLSIAIEVDEPYVYSTKEPIHYYGVNIDNPLAGADDEINDGLLWSGWIVVRFTERQVVQNTTACVDFIEQLHKQVVLQEELINIRTFVGYYHFPHNTRDLRWTLAEAYAMAATDYRKSYLKGSR